MRCDTLAFKRFVIADEIFYYPKVSVMYRVQTMFTFLSLKFMVDRIAINQNPCQIILLTE